MKPVLLVIGTRPDAIKLIPLYLALKKEQIPVVLCSTFQHDTILWQVLNIFGIVPDISLNVMRENQDLFYLTGIIIEKIKDICLEYDPAIVIVQGDTTTAFASALSSFYLKIPVGHVEAGIRSFDKYGPFPEEIYRKMISTFATLHFAPTQNSVLNLLHEGVSRSTIFQTGNTVTDAIRITKSKIANNEISVDVKLIFDIQDIKSRNKKLIYMTTHRRESFGKPLEDILNLIKNYAQSHQDLEIIFPVHPNPNVKFVVDKLNFSKIDNIRLYEPLSYENSIYLLSNSDLVVTDSGGLQEEAASIHKPAVILRDRTDRPESVLAGMAAIGSDGEKITKALDDFLYLKEPINYVDNIYGDGYVSEKIVSILKNFMNNSLFISKSDFLQEGL